MKENNIYVPIGCDCSVTWYLRQHGLRHHAFPFDWNVTPISSAVQLINNGFQNFLELESLTFLKSTNRLLFQENGIDVTVTEDIITPVYDSKYHMLFPHDFSKKGKLDYESVKEKYLRRVSRLNFLLKNNDLKIYFIYNNTYPNEWQATQYEIAKYQFNKLKNSDISKLTIKRDNSILISFEDFKTSLQRK